MDYLTLHVYSGAERVYIATEPLIRGTYINSPHLLVRWRSPPDGGKFTIVVASHEQLSKEIRFSLRCFGDVPIVVREAGKLANRMQLHGEWNDQTAGGAMSSSMFYANPQFEIIVPQRTELTLVLSTPEFPVNVKLVRKKGRVSSVGKGQVVLGSGDYRHGGCVARGVVEPGTYVAIASTYEPRMFAKFRLDFYSSVSLSIREISAEGHGMHRAELRGEWVAGTSAVGCVHFRLYERNPAFEFALSKPGRVMVRLQAIMEPAPPINVAIFRLGETGWGGDEVVGSGAYTDWIQGVVTPPKKLEPGKYVFVCSTWEPTPGRFRAVFYAEESVTPVAVARVATDS